MRKFAQCIDALHEEAMRVSGLSDFGDLEYLEDLRTLLDAYDSDCRFTQNGEATFDSIKNILISRLHTQDVWNKDPGTRLIPIRRPLIIVGLPRTGTTALQRLLSVDPQFQGLQLWICDKPRRRPPRDTWESLPEYRECVARYSERDLSLNIIHELSANELDECDRVLMQSFVSRGSETTLPSYDPWLQAHDLRPCYRRYADVLRLIGANESDKTWLLKDPFHNTHLDALLESFPDARFVMTHRDPAKAIPSWHSLTKQYARRAGMQLIADDYLGERICEYWRRALGCIDRTRARVPTQFFDVDHCEFVASPLLVIRSLYRHFEFSLSAQTEAKMRAWIGDSPTSRHGKHRYDSEPIDVTRDEIRSRLADYCRTHGFTQRAVVRAE